jgi:hypothetical protein
MYIVTGTAREEAVGRPSIEEGSMSVALPDPAARLLNLPPTPIGPPQPVEPPLTDEATDERRPG